MKSLVVKPSRADWKEAENRVFRRGGVALQAREGVHAMQRVLEKMAKQLNNYDEASLMQLWQRYAAQVHDFEPTRRWEEAAIALCLIQAIHWKNQLFNYHLAVAATPVDKRSLPPLPEIFAAQRARSIDTAKPEARAARARATVLRFPEKSGTGTKRDGTASEKDMDNGAKSGKDSGRSLLPGERPEADN
jgi:hypothetical protein